MTPLLVLAGLWILLGAVWLATWPLLTERAGEDAAGAERRDLEAEKDRLVREIHELDLDRATGKLSEEDYRELDASLKRRAVDKMERIDAIEPPIDDPA